jgi:hypothetical protein
MAPKTRVTEINRKNKRGKSMTCEEVKLTERIKVIWIGFEPTTYCLEGSCSIQLSYQTEKLFLQIFSLKEPMTFPPKSGMLYPTELPDRKIISSNIFFKRNDLPA